MAEEDDTVDAPLDDAGPPRSVVSLYRALAKMQSCYDQVGQAIEISDRAALERVATRAVFWWHVALAVLWRLAHSSEHREHVGPALCSVTEASQHLSALFRNAARKVRSSKPTMAQLRLWLVNGTKLANSTSRGAET